ncbi:MAG: class I SAM-dependent methyltransferase [Candidatus Hodarchaeota archaeon]
MKIIIDDNNISNILKNNATHFYKGLARSNALRAIQIKSKYITTIFKVVNTISTNINKIKILDIGCSKCDILLALQKLGLKKLTGLNLFSFDVNWLSNAQYYEEYFGDSIGKIRYITCDVDKESLPFKDSSYDIILMMDVIEHLHDPERVLLECYRILTSNGLIAIGTCNATNLKNRVFALFGKSVYFPLDEWLGKSQRINDDNFRRFIGHIREYTMQELNYMLKKYGFHVLLQKYYASNLKNAGILYIVYNLFEKIYAPFSYHLLIIGQK